MRTIKTIRVCGMAGMIVLGAVTASAQTSETTFNFNVGQVIPDNNLAGLTISTNLTIDGAIGITSVKVTLDITGGFNGDLYAYLLGPNGGYAVLLNRSGIGSGNTFGYSDTGFQLTFDDSAASSIHFYQSTPGGYSVNGSGQVTGVWQPDGETVDPRSSPSVFDAQIQGAMLSSLYGTDPNGTWTLFFADVSGGGQSTLANVGLDIVTTVPEPSSLALTGLGVAGMCALLRRRRK